MIFVTQGRRSFTILDGTWLVEYAVPTVGATVSFPTATTVKILFPSRASLNVRFLNSASALAAFLPATLAASAIHIAPSGNDTNAGSAIAPVATPQAAQSFVRSMIASGLTEPDEVS